jgi:hypothetical protein
LEKAHQEIAAKNAEIEMLKKSLLQMKYMYQGHSTSQQANPHDDVF